MEYERKGCKYSLEEIIRLIKSNKNHILLDGDKINIFSIKLLTFLRCGVKCIRCGIKGSFFVKERHIGQNHNNFHLSLYAIDKFGKEVLMTSDHIIPRSKGGAIFGITNRQTMCLNCNMRKGNKFNIIDIKNGSFRYGKKFIEIS